MFAFCRPGHARSCSTNQPGRLELREHLPGGTFAVQLPLPSAPADRSSRAIFSRRRRAISSAELPALVVMAGRLN